MTNFTSLLNRFLDASRRQEFWRHKGELASLRGIALGVAINISVLIGALVSSFSGSVVTALAVSTASLPILFPLSIFAVSRYWRGRHKPLFDEGDFNKRQLLKDEYEDEIRRIEELGLSQTKKDKLKVEAYKRLQSDLREILTFSRRHQVPSRRRA